MIKQTKIKDSPEPMSVSGTKKILTQMMNCICKIKLKGKTGTCFFVKIPYDNNIIINALMTNYHIIDEIIYKENKELNLLLNDEKQAKVIDLTKKREKYFNEEYDITIIELKESDNINNFIELDDNLFKDESKTFYENESIYLLHYPNNNALVSYGLLIELNNFEIKHKCNTDNGSSGSPILNLKTCKVIGIHKEGSNVFNFNKGTLLKFTLNDFIKKIKIKSTNIIKTNNNIIKDESHNNESNIIENIYMKEFEKNMNKGYELNIIKNKINEYINQLNDDDMIYHVFYDFLRPQGIINKKDFLIIRKTLGIIHHNWYSIDFTNGSSKKKYRVKFVYATGLQNCLILDYDTTINEMLNNFLLSIHRLEIKYLIEDKIAFTYNAQPLHIKPDDTPIEKIFGQNLNPTIVIFDQEAVLPSHIGYERDED